MFKSSLAPRIVIVMLMAALTSCSGNWSSPFESGQVSETRPTSKAIPIDDQQGVMARSVTASGEEQPVAVTMSGGGEIGMHSMDATDKSKMSRALDAATGKSTSWTNGRTGIKFTVTPIKKVIIKDNPFCRQYQVNAEKGEYKKDMSGKACVMTDGSWHTI